MTRDCVAAFKRCTLLRRGFEELEEFKGFEEFDVLRRGVEQILRH
jgi:hypothetical protein